MDIKNTFFCTIWRGSWSARFGSLRKKVSFSTLSFKLRISINCMVSTNLFWKYSVNTKWQIQFMKKKLARAASEKVYKSTQQLVLLILLVQQIKKNKPKRNERECNGQSASASIGMKNWTRKTLMKTITKAWYSKFEANFSKKKKKMETLANKQQDLMAGQVLNQQEPNCLTRISNL